MGAVLSRPPPPGLNRINLHTIGRYLPPRGGVLAKKILGEEVVRGIFVRTSIMCQSVHHL